MSEETYEGILRNKIPWYPKIDYEKCVTCRKCISNRAISNYRYNVSSRSTVLVDLELLSGR